MVRDAPLHRSATTAGIPTSTAAQLDAYHPGHPLLGRAECRHHLAFEPAPRPHVQATGIMQSVWLRPCWNPTPHAMPRVRLHRPHLIVKCLTQTMRREREEEKDNADGLVGGSMRKGEKAKANTWIVATSPVPQAEGHQQKRTHTPAEAAPVTSTPTANPAVWQWLQLLDRLRQVFTHVSRLTMQFGHTLGERAEKSTRLVWLAVIGEPACVQTEMPALIMQA